MSMDNVLIQRTPYMLYAGRVQIEFTSSLALLITPGCVAIRKHELAGSAPVVT